jgi:hypothetical protein
MIRGRFGTFVLLKTGTGGGLVEVIMGNEMNESGGFGAREN